MIVVDTNLLVYLLLPTPYTAQAEAILAVDSDWIASALFIPSYVMFFWVQSGVAILR